MLVNFLLIESSEEADDVIKAYLKHEGAIEKIQQDIPLATIDGNFNFYICFKRYRWT
jgi:hypothetical protein